MCRDEVTISPADAPNEMSHSAHMQVAEVLTVVLTDVLFVVELKGGTIEQFKIYVSPYALSNTNHGPCN